MSDTPIEGTIITWLGQRLPVGVFGEVPADRPPRFVTVERTGGPLETFIDYPNLAIQTWGTSKSDAATLADDVRQVLPQLTSVDKIARVDIGSTYNWPDPLSGQARYQTILSLTVKWER